MKQHLGLIGGILPVVLVAIALIGFILTLRNDVNGVVKQLDEAQQQIEVMHERFESERSIRTNLHMDQTEDLTKITNDINERINGLETSLAVAEDQQKTIMGDHMGFAEVLKELGESGALPSGERREYGGYTK